MALEEVKILEKLRKNIDAVDEQLARLLVQRFKLSGEIAEYKRQKKIPILDQKRETEIIEDLTRRFKELGFEDEIFAAELFGLILRRSREVQR